MAQTDDDLYRAGLMNNGSLHTKQYNQKFKEFYFKKMHYNTFKYLDSTQTDARSNQGKISTTVIHIMENPQGH